MLSANLVQSSHHFLLFIPSSSYKLCSHCVLQYLTSNHFSSICTICTESLDCTESFFSGCALLYRKYVEIYYFSRKSWIAFCKCIKWADEVCLSHLFYADHYLNIHLYIHSFQMNVSHYLTHIWFTFRQVPAIPPQHQLTNIIDYISIFCRRIAYG